LPPGRKYGIIIQTKDNRYAAKAPPASGLVKDVAERNPIANFLLTTMDAIQFFGNFISSVLVLALTPESPANCGPAAEGLWFA